MFHTAAAKREEGGDVAGEKAGLGLVGEYFANEFFQNVLLHPLLVTVRVNWGSITAPLAAAVEARLEQLGYCRYVSAPTPPAGAPTAPAGPTGERPPPTTSPLAFDAADFERGDQRIKN